MEFVLSLKALWQRRLYVVPGLVLALLLALLVVSPGRQRVWVASAQVLTDAQISAIGNLNQGFDPLVPRATVYANLMTSPALVQLISQAAHIPADVIAVTGPLGTNGQRAQHGATAVAPGGRKYTLRLDTDVTQPIIRITAQAPTSRSALALANGAAAGLTTYVTQFELAQAIPQRHRVDVRELGPAIESPSDSGITPLLFFPLFIGLSVVWCMLVLFASRFAHTWRNAPDNEVTVDPYGGGSAVPLWPDSGSAGGDLTPGQTLFDAESSAGETASNAAEMAGGEPGRKPEDLALHTRRRMNR
jgi:hypothetical protein